MKIQITPILWSFLLLTILIEAMQTNLTYFDIQFKELSKSNGNTNYNCDLTIGKIMFLYCNNDIVFWENIYPFFRDHTYGYLIE